MATSQATMEAMKRESRANAKEDMVTLASEARQKVDRALASVKEVGGKIAHPFDAGARGAAHNNANSLRRQSSEKQANLRQMARQTAEDERLAGRNQVAQQVVGGAGKMRYPVPVYPPDDSQQQQQEHPPRDEHPVEHHVEHPPTVDNPPQDPALVEPPSAEHTDKAPGM